MKSNYTDQQCSVLLNKEENDQVFQLLGLKCQTLATTVIQLYATDGPESTYWIKRDVGVLCLVRDVNKRSYFFRLYCLVRNRMVWEHEIYNNMQYLAPRSYLHTFEAEERIVAFNFANEDEAAYLRKVLLEKLKFKAQRRLDKKNRENHLNRSQSTNQTLTRPAPVQMPVSNSNTIGNGFLSSKSKSSKLSGPSKKSKKKCITKDDISQPSDFVHVSHVGFDKNAGFQMDNIDATMRQFFVKVGVSEEELNDKKTLEYIYDFIEKHGGYDAVKQNVHQSSPVPASPPPPPPVPARNVPTPSSTGTLTRTAPPPPPPPSGTQRVMHPAPPPPPSGPPPSNVLIQRNQNQLRKYDVTSKSPPPNNVPPPPPPPPPLPAANPIEKSLSTSSPSAEPVARNSGADPRSALMEAIRGGARLKHVETEAKKQSGDDSRGELLSQIRQGVELKSVPQVSKPANSLANNDLASALARALAERAELMHTDSSDSDDTDDSDNEWED